MIAARMRACGGLHDAVRSRQALSYASSVHSLHRRRRPTAARENPDSGAPAWRRPARRRRCPRAGCGGSAWEIGLSASFLRA